MGCCSSAAQSSKREWKPLEDHSCTDVPWLLLFILFCIGMGFICGFSIATGAAARLLSGYDSYGNICGQKNVKVEGIVNSGLDLTQKKYVFFLDPCNIDIVHQKIKSIALCVSACPRKELKSLADIQKFAETNGSTLCSYELQPSEYTTDPRAAKLCPKYPVPESAPIPFFHRCAPVNISCYAKFAEALITFVSDSSVLHRLISGVMTSKEIIMGLCLLSLVLSMILMVIIRYISRVLVWILTILVILGSLGGTGVLWWLYAKQRISAGALETQIAKDNLQALLIYAIAATVFTVIMLLIVLIMRKRVALTIALFHVAGKVFIHLPLLVFQPFWTFFVLIVFWTYWITVLLFLGTTGSPVPNEEGFVEFRMAGPLKYMWWYHVVGLIWISEFILACQQMTVAGAVVTYYFTREKRNLPFTPILASVNRLVCYHLGTVAKGSFIITLVKIPRMILMYIHTQLKGKENACARCMLKACICCLWCLEKCLTYLNQNAYTATAINSTNFCTSAKDAFVILVENALRVAAINTVGDFMLFLGKVLIVCSTGLAGIMLLNYQRDYTIWVLPLIIVCLFAFLVAHCFLSIYEMVVDVLFLCFAIDTKYNDGSPGREFYMDKVLMEFVENSRKSMKEAGRGGGAEGRELKPMSIPSGGKGLDSPSGRTHAHRQSPCCGPKVFCCMSVFCRSTEDLLGTLEEILPKLQKDVSVWIMAKDSRFPGVHTLLDKIEAASEDPVPVNRCSANNLKSAVLYIFTSGTTGLPKAAVISHLQILKGAAGLWAFGATSEDIIYITLPLYHSAASLLGIGGCIELGATCVLKKKFSASQFWSDCRRYNVTVIQYIGELCRYLCNQPVVGRRKKSQSPTSSWKWSEK
ncbi:long-chain fatty acid transport protein 6 isoform X2 [Oenanthe melanoleuca]|uniref:long-chain fatty acid transport protein 6 isoform X2 n=1 Tax=Oenanthe melanoleuca TaxID=2939378 RepID=UPI0024C10073|nr:long-chain fatty acid transport protein 6 isoform X2 [Oenanthe melanoleuca]